MQHVEINSNIAQLLFFKYGTQKRLFSKSKVFNRRFFLSDLVSEYQQYQEATTEDEEFHEDEEAAHVDAE
jgi:hypothetical protein